MMARVGQLAFDFDELAREDARAAVGSWEGAPLHFTTGYYSTGALEAAFEHWCLLYTHFDSLRRSHMWHRSIGTREDTVLGEHVAAVFTAELRPGVGEAGPGGLVARMVCEPCRWQVTTGDENSAVEAWHDHALPGWRELPVVPAAIRVRDEKGLTKLARAWIAKNYPADVQVPGAPIVTERVAGATRHVPAYSPWGGYDLSSTALGHPTVSRDEHPTLRRRSPAVAEVRRPASDRQAPGLGD